VRVLRPPREQALPDVLWHGGFGRLHEGRVACGRGGW
jgi:hypothetical protein